ncbi:MAG: YidC/Oxa1 family membrane protein insertase, partial [Clostridia bacterium]|nr:YidC/Oxa1 family membrane protein insertase [Clostridia bacterium]
LSGCLPMFIQLPIIMSLYNVIVSPLQNMFMLTNDKINTLIKAILPYCSTTDPASSLLSQKALTELTKSSRLAQTEIINLVRDGKLDMLTGDAGDVVNELKGMSQFFPSYNAFGLDFSLQPPMPSAESFKELWPLIFVPVLIVVTMILSTKLSRKFTYQDPTMQQQQDNCSMKVMMYSMPLLSASIAFSLPAAVGVYWIYRSIVSTLQQFLLSVFMPLPKFTEEDYKKAEKEFAGKSEKQQKKKNEKGGNVGKYAYNADGTVKRSLHHIDEDDTPAPLPVKKEEAKLAEGVDPADAPVMKDDRGTEYKKKTK